MSSRYLERVLAGETPTEPEWHDHLQAFLKEFPDSTFDVLCELPSASGATSYEMLLDAAIAGRRKIDAFLDLGCGGGTFLKLAQSALAHTSLYGLDLSESELELARAILGEGVQLVCGDAAHLPFADGSMDTVTAHLSLSLMYDVVAVLKEVRRVLAPGGRFIFVVEDYLNRKASATALALSQVLRELFPRFVLRPICDVRMYSEAGIHELLAEAGFRASVQVRNYEVGRVANADEFWRYIQRSSIVGMLDPALQSAIHARMNTGLGYPVLVSVPLRLVTVG